MRTDDHENGAFEEDELPWPEKGDRLFAEATDWHLNACMKISPGDWYPYIEGYGKAADLLVEHLVRGEGRSVDLLVYPIAFLYRHHLELRLKAIILDGGLLYDRHCKLPSTHNILSLWMQCRKILERTWPKGPSTELDAIEACIDEFCQLDKNSFSFRYPLDKKENPTLDNAPDRINVRHLANTMSKISNLLGGAHTGIQQYLEYKCEAEAEYRSEMERCRAEIEAQFRSEIESYY